MLANCANTTPSGKGCAGSRECGAFSDPKYGKASPRVVSVDEDAPKGGGRYQVGKAYTVAGKTYVPREKPVGYTATGNASWYGIAFHGRKTANGEVYDRNSVSAAHPTMPLPSYARVTNLSNNTSIVVRVNDRGPYHGGRVMDVSEKTAHLLNFKHMGTARVKIDYLGPASLAGSDDKKLVASLSTSGPAASPLANGGPTMVASAEPVASARPTTVSAGAVSAGNVSSGMTARADTALGFASQPAPTPVSRPPQADSGTITQTRFTPVDSLPLPPQRPFDLDTIGGAATPQAVEPDEVAEAAPPKHRPTALSFTSMDGGYSRFGKVPFDRMGEFN